MFRVLSEILGPGNWIIDFTIEEGKLTWMMRSKVNVKSAIEPIVIIGTPEQFDAHFLEKLQEEIPEEVKFEISEASKMLDSLKKAEEEAKEKKKRPAASKPKAKEEAKKPSLF